MILMCILPLTDIWVASEAMASSKQPQKPQRSNLSDLRFEISNIIYPGIHVHVASYYHFAGL